MPALIPVHGGRPDLNSVITESSDGEGPRSKRRDNSQVDVSILGTAVTHLERHAPMVEIN